MKNLLGWISAFIGAAVTAIIVLSLLAHIGDGGRVSGDALIVTDAGFRAFTVSLWMALAFVGALLFVWERFGLDPSRIAYAALAPLTAFFGLIIYFRIVFDYPMTMSVDGGEIRLLIAFAVAGAIFAQIRLLTR